MRSLQRCLILLVGRVLSLLGVWSSLLAELCKQLRIICGEEYDLISPYSFLPFSLSLSLLLLPLSLLPLLFSCPLIFKDGTGGTYGSWYWCRVSQCSTCIYYFLSQYLLILFSPNYFDYDFKSTVCIACKFNAYFKAQVLSSCFK